MEFTEDCKKCEKNSEGENSNFKGEFGKLSLQNLFMGDRRIQKKFWSIFKYGTSKSEFVCESYARLKNRLWIRGQNGPEVEKIYGGG